MGKEIEADWVMVTRCRDCAWYETGISETARGMCSVYSDTGAGFGGDMYPLQTSDQRKKQVLPQLRGGHEKGTER